jgi:hypothetical protein
MATALSYLAGQTLAWVPTAAFKDRYDLIGPGNAPVATLDMSTWTSKANAQVPEGTLFLHKEGLIGLKVAVYSGDDGPLVANFQRKWTGTSGQLTCADGRQFKWGKANFWGTQKVWTDPTGKTTYVQLSTSSAGGFSRKSNVVVFGPAAEVPELSLLLVLGIYNIIVERRDRRNAAAAANHQRMA